MGSAARGEQKKRRERENRLGFKLIGNNEESNPKTQLISHNNFHQNSH